MMPKRRLKPVAGKTLTKIVPLRYCMVGLCLTLGRVGATKVRDRVHSSGTQPGTDEWSPTWSGGRSVCANLRYRLSLSADNSSRNRKMDQMENGSSGPGPELPSGADDGEATRASLGHEPVTPPPAADPANPPPRPWWEAARAARAEAVTQPPAADPANPPPQPSWEAAPTGGAETVTRLPAADPANPSLQPSSDVVRYGPGVPVNVPASQAGLQAERLWHTGHLAEKPRRRGKLRRLLGSALTVILLAAAGVVLYLRFHHAPFHVTGVVISQQAKSGCGVDVTGRISTNGAAGTVSYQWVTRPERQPPHPLSEPVAAGQNPVYVTVPVKGQGHGSASETVTLQVLGPDTGSASTDVVVSC